MLKIHISDLTAMNNALNQGLELDMKLSVGLYCYFKDPNTPITPTKRVRTRIYTHPKYELRGRVKGMSAVYV